MEWTALVAGYGAFVSTAVAAWNIYRQVTNRGRLRVQVYTAVQAVPGLGVIAEDRLAYSITNVGRQPIWLRQIGGSYGDREFLIDTVRPLPCKLEPGETFLEGHASAADILDGSHRPIFLGVWDTTGTIYKVPRRAMKTLLKGRPSQRL